jgi:hypothetical protein
MNGFDLENPLRVDNCEQCGAVHWRDCICSPDRPFRQPTQAELEAGREERLARPERAQGGVR